MAQVDLASFLESRGKSVGKQRKEFDAPGEIYSSDRCDQSRHCPSFFEGLFWAPTESKAKLGGEVAIFVVDVYESLANTKCYFRAQVGKVEHKERRRGVFLSCGWDQVSLALSVWRVWDTLGLNAATDMETSMKQQ